MVAQARETRGGAAWEVAASRAGGRGDGVQRGREGGLFSGHGAWKTEWITQERRCSSTQWSKNAWVWLGTKRDRAQGKVARDVLEWEEHESCTSEVILCVRERCSGAGDERLGRSQGACVRRGRSRRGRVGPLHTHAGSQGHVGPAASRR